MLRYRRSQVNNLPSKVPRSSNDTINPTVKHNFQSTSLPTFADNSDLDELIDNDNVSNITNTIFHPFGSSLLCVKSIIPSAGPQHTNHH
jgi:hypothetical protein